MNNVLFLEIYRKREILIKSRVFFFLPFTKGEPTLWREREGNNEHFTALFQLIFFGFILRIFFSLFLSFITFFLLLKWQKQKQSNHFLFTRSSWLVQVVWVNLHLPYNTCMVTLLKNTILLKLTVII